MLVTGPAAGAAEKTIAEVLPRLPAEAFDNTTEGIETGELKELVAKGASANWTLAVASPQKAVATARRPRAEVHMTRKQLDGTDLVEALTFNERAVSYSYWAVGPAGQPLTAHTPIGMTRLLNESHDGSGPIALDAVPAPIRTYMDKLDKCQHWMGEAGDDGPPARQREIAAQIRKLGCATRQRDEKALKAQFRGDARWQSLLARATAVFGE